MASNYGLCVLELFTRDNNGIMGNRQAEVLEDTVLQQAISISDGIWTVATRSEIE